MKIIAIIGIVSLLTACHRVEQEPIEVPQEVCTGKLEKVSGKHLRMSCDNGQIIDYTSYKYDMTQK